MKNITFKQQFTFNEESVKGFAIHLGWQETLTRQTEVMIDDVPTLQNEDYPNPQTFAEYVDEKAREHTLKFTKSWAEQLKNSYLNAQVQEFKTTVEPSLNDQIIKPVEDALISEILISE